MNLPQEKLKITTFQAYLFWENIETNLKNLELKLSSKLGDMGTDLIVLPEMFNTGFTLNASKLAEEMEGKTMTWMHKLASKFNCVVTGSLIILEHEKYYNRLIWMRPDGTYSQYDKRHLFNMGDEHLNFTAGQQKVMVELKGWKFLLGICYDLRFPVFLRNDKANPYDILLIIASWPDKRISHWRALLLSRAIENQCFTIGLNRVGYDGMEIYHSGQSMCIDPYGNTVYYKPEDEDLYTFSICYSEITKTRRAYPFLKDGDSFSLA